MNSIVDYERPHRPVHIIDVYRQFHHTLAQQLKIEGYLNPTLTAISMSLMLLCNTILVKHQYSRVT